MKEKLTQISITIPESLLIKFERASKQDNDIDP